MKRLRHLPTRALLTAALLMIGPALSVAKAQESAFTLETIELIGNARTDRETVFLYLPLREGDRVSPSEILDAVESLRARELFDTVDYELEKGSERGLVLLRLRVKEQGVDLRFGTGYRDLDGWYLIPLQLRFDNRLGRGERARAQMKIGYRIFGAELFLQEPRFGKDGRGFWGVDLAGYARNRLYFLDGVEYAHNTQQGLFGAHVGRRFGSSWRLEVGASFQRFDTDSTSQAYEHDEIREIDRGDDLPFADLPPSIAADIGEDDRNAAHVEVVYDSRSSRRIAATPVSGIWGRVRGEGWLRNGADFGAVTADARAYRRVAGGALALRARGGAIGEAARFYDRFYLGGLYTVRGFPSTSLTPPGGHTRFWTGSLEFRGPMVGRPDRPRLAGVLFVDAGYGWTDSGADFEDTAVSAGWGFRLRVPWIDTVGVDFGIPLTDTPTDSAWHANFALGWNW